MATTDLYLNDNSVIICPEGRTIDEKTVSEALQLHQTLISRYQESMNFYKGEHEILTQSAKPEFKPDHRVVVNLAKYIVDTYTSYFIGIPMKVTHEKDAINEFIRVLREENNLDDNEYELAKISAIYGRAYEYLSQDENAKTVITYDDPLNTFVVYDNTIYRRPLFAVDYTQDSGGTLTGVVFTSEECIELSGSTSGARFGERDVNVYQGLPIIEYVENEERLSVFEPVKTLINSINKTLSEKMNDVDAMADAYLSILGAKLENGDLEFIRDNRIINFEGLTDKPITAQFLGKPNADVTQENLLTRLTDLVFQIAMVANINDESFGNASGVALEFKLQPMKNLAQAKERKLKKAIRQRYQLIFSLPTNVNAASRDQWTQLNYTFTRNIPRNISDEADTAKKLEGIVPKELQLSVLSIVDNPKDVADQMEEDSNNGLIFDFEQSQELTTKDELEETA